MTDQPKGSPANTLEKECIRCGHHFLTRGNAQYETTCKGCLLERRAEGAHVNPWRIALVSYRID